MKQIVIDYIKGVLELIEVQDKIDRGLLDEKEEDDHLDRLDDIWKELSEEDAFYVNQLNYDKVTNIENLPFLKT